MSDVRSSESSPSSSSPSPSSSSSTSSRAAVVPSNIPLLVAAFIASLTTGGPTYSFGLYGTELKRTLNLSQAQLNTISSSYFCAGLFSWVPGLCVDRFGPRYALMCGGVSMCLSNSSYWIVARELIPMPPHLLVPVLSAMGVWCFASSAMITGSVFKLIVASCGPGSKGSAVGVAKGYVGLGAGAYTILFENLRGRNGLVQRDLDFLPMAAFFGLAAVTVPAFCLVPSKRDMAEHPRADATTPLHFRTLYLGLVALAVLVIGSSIVSLCFTPQPPEIPYPIGTVAESHGSADYVMAVAVVLIWFGPIYGLLCLPRSQQTEAAFAIDTDMDDAAVNAASAAAGGGNGGGGVVSSSSSSSSMPPSVPLKRRFSDDITRSLIESAVGVDEETESFVNWSGGAAVDENQNGYSLTSRHDDHDHDHNHDDNGDHHHHHHHHHHEPSSSPQSSVFVRNRNLKEMLKTRPAWLMLWTTTILVGGGTVMTNNMGQMSEALHFDDRVGPASLALFSVAQAFARVVMGGLSESALSWRTMKGCGGMERGLSRPFFLVVASLAGAVSHGLLGGATTLVPFVSGVALSGAAFGMVWPLMVLVAGELFGTANVGANYMFFDGISSALGTLLLSNFVAQEVYEKNIDPSTSPNSKTCLGSSCFRKSHFIISALALTGMLTSLCLMYTRLSREAYGRRRASVATAMHIGNGHGHGHGLSIPLTSNDR